jgi:hypothetical protein
MSAKPRRQSIRWAVLALVTAVVVCLRVAFGQGFGEFVSPGKLAQPHAHLEGIKNCTQCHSLGQGVSPNACMDCHTEVKDQVKRRDGFHADKGTKCQSCHPDHRGREFQLVQLQQKAFDHTKTGFPLKDAHARAACTDCHTKAEGKGTETGGAPPTAEMWKGLSRDCLSCHEDEDPHRGKLPSGGLAGHALLGKCASCHDVKDWNDASPIPTTVFDHTSPTMTDYPLEGRHKPLRCAECHEKWHFVPQAHEDCLTCHRDPHRGAQDHGFGKPCASCHPTPTGWAVKAFDHTLSGYELEGEHADVKCEKCHTARHTARSRLTAVAHEDCDSCHEDPHAAKFEPTPCFQCHAPTSWKEVADFDHTRTKFPLEGAHEKVECDACHLKVTATGEKKSQFSDLPHELCTDCHQDDNPHTDAVKPETCTDCHTVQTWKEIDFEHATDTSFPLEPQHTEVECDACHVSKTDFGLKLGADSGTDLGDCRTCHEDDRPPVHYEGQSCGECHEGTKWYPGGLGDNPHDITGFALHGAHLALDCDDCHEAGEPKGLASSFCADCHGTDDPHKNMLGRQCDDCHTETTWLRVDFQHAETGWPLRGAHRLAACWDCHAAGYAGTPTDCWRCHEAAAPASVPAHQSAFFPYCDSCHRPYTWAVTGPRSP